MIASYASPKGLDLSRSNYASRPVPMPEPANTWVSWAERSR
ncbi:hypothetical protein [Spirulina major]|nr:hypothetical protein [Spirulina major]